MRYGLIVVVVVVVVVVIIIIIIIIITHQLASYCVISVGRYLRT